MSEALKVFLKARRDRALGSILGHAEREIWDSLTPEQRANLRRCVLDALNMYHDTVLDLFKGDAVGFVRNDEVLATLSRIEARLPGSSHRVPAPPGAPADS